MSYLIITAYCAVSKLNHHFQLNVTCDHDMHRAYLDQVKHTYTHEMKNKKTNKQTKTQEFPNSDPRQSKIIQSLLSKVLLFQFFCINGKLYSFKLYAFKVYSKYGKQKFIDVMMSSQSSEILLSFESQTLKTNNI